MSKANEIIGDETLAGGLNALSEDTPLLQAEVHDEGKFVRVTLRLADHEDKAFQIGMEGNVLSISSKTFTQKTSLPFTPKPNFIHSYRNGILEIKVFK